MLCFCISANEPDDLFIRLMTNVIHPDLHHYKEVKLSLASKIPVMPCLAENTVHVEIA